MTLSDDAGVRRRRIAFRAWHRGTREMDLIMGRFAEAELPKLADRELEQFEALLEEPDTDVYGWVTGLVRPSPEHDTPVLARLRAFHRVAG